MSTLREVRAESGIGAVQFAPPFNSLSADDIVVELMHNYVSVSYSPNTYIPYVSLSVFGLAEEILLLPIVKEKCVIYTINYYSLSTINLKF